MEANWQRPALSIYISFFVLSFITINTYYLVFFEIQYRYYLWVALAGGYLVSIYLHQRYKPYLEIFINVFALIFFAFFFREIFKNITNFGSMLGQLLAILLVMRSYILFSKDDFLVPLVVSITLMLLCSIPSYESNYVISLQIFLVLVVISLYLLAKHREIDETRTGIFAIERSRKSYSPRNETKIIAFFSLTALISST